MLSTASNWPVANRQNTGIAIYYRRASVDNCRFVDGQVRVTSARRRRVVTAVFASSTGIPSSATVIRLPSLDQPVMTVGQSLSSRILS